jgi:hypothetical protein
VLEEKREICVVRKKRGKHYKKKMEVSREKEKNYKKKRRIVRKRESL